MRVVVGMRLEYLLAVTTQDAAVFARSLRDRLGAEVDLLQLGYFPNDVIRRYLGDRLGRSELFDERIRDQGYLTDILRRPLYLRLFCDLLGGPLKGRDEEMLAIGHVAELFEKFIEHAAAPGDEVLPGTRVRGRWDIDGLAQMSLHLFELGVDRVSLAELALHVVLLEEPLGGEAAASEARKHYVHKCPFLQRGPSDTMRFAHRSFLEFLTAKGITLALCRDENVRPFDELVANVDMRRFLTYLIAKHVRGNCGWEKDSKEFYVEATRRGNGMYDTAAWQLVETSEHPAGALQKGGQFWNELERHRRNLLLSMIEPESPLPDTLGSIHWFLDHEGDGLDYRYLMYNYEAVAVNIRFRWWESQYAAVAARFSEILRGRLTVLLQEMSEGCRPPSAYLLLHRITDIARRLRYDWIQEYRELIREELNRCDDGAVFTRIRMVLEQLEHIIR